MTILKTISSQKIDANHMIYSVMHNEMYYLPQWLSHYRQLGAKKFVILDDHSNDGSTEFLMAQPDCIVLQSKHRFGDIIDGKRFVTIARTLIPKLFSNNSWTIGADADEFLLLPSKIATLDKLFKQVPTRYDVIGTLMIDFYPRNISDLYSSSPETGLFEQYPYYDNTPHLSFDHSQKQPNIICHGPRERLFQQYGIDIQTPYIYKQSIVRWAQNKRFKNSHTIHPALPCSYTLPLAHFKFTKTLPGKIDFAIESKGYWQASKEYVAYNELVKRMTTDSGSFVYEKSDRYTNNDNIFTSRIFKNDSGIQTLETRHLIQRLIEKFKHL